MIRVLLFILTVLVLASMAHAQLPTLTNPDPPCWMCVESPPAGTFSERHYQRQQRTPSYTAPTLPSYDRGYTPGQNRPNHSLNDRTYRDPGMSYGAEYWWPTPEQQMQSDRLAIEEYEAGYGCNSWSLDGC